MTIEYFRPDEIEHESFAMIAAELQKRGLTLPPDQEFVTKRVIHTTADFDYAETLCFSDHAVERAIALLREGADIVTDTNMAKAGINKKYLAKLGGEVHCWMADPDVAAEAKSRGITRAAVSMEHAAKLPGHVIFAIGNAPTALVSLYELMTGQTIMTQLDPPAESRIDKSNNSLPTSEISRWQPDFVIGVPVGFVNVEAAKELFLDSDVPHIVNRGRKGGSNVAAAICNALIYQAVGRQ